MGAINPGSMRGHHDLCPPFCSSKWERSCFQSYMPYPKQVHEVTCRKTQAWYGISPNSTRQDHQRREGVWPGSSVDAPTPSPPPLHGWASMHKLALLINIGTDWAYALACNLMKTHCTHPCPVQGHISEMVDGVPSTNACWCLRQLEVHKLLQCEDQVVCPKGLNVRVRTHAVHLFRTPCLEHRHPWWTHPWAITPMSEPLQHEAERWGAHHLSPPTS